VVPGTGIRAAIIEDEPFVIEGLTEILTEAGHVVSAVARTRDEALALVEQGGQFDVVFVDLGLGGKPAGIDVARRAVRNELAVVVMTGGAVLPTDLAGAGLLLKPFSAEAVRAILHTLLRR